MIVDIDRNNITAIPFLLLNSPFRLDTVLDYTIVLFYTIPVF